MKNKSAYPMSAGVATSLALATTFFLAACGNSHAVISSEDCGAGNSVTHLAQARVAFVGVMLPGPTVTLDGHPELLSPAKMRVAHYVKGSGSKTVTVTTAATSASNVNAEGIAARPGQTWMIYSGSAKAPYMTSVCNGSRPVRSR